MKPAVRLLVTVAVMGAAVACGKKGPPLPPLRPVPAAVSVFTAERSGSDVTLRFVVPPANQDGSTPPAIDRVELYALTLPATAAAPTASEIVQPSNLLATTVTARPAQNARPEAGATGPEPGTAASHVDELHQRPDETRALVRYYAATAAAGRRHSAASAILAVPLSEGPPPPAAVTPDYTETSLTVTWSSTGEAARFIVAVAAAGVETTLTPEPIAGPTFTTRVEFGVERCFVVRAVRERGPVAIVGPRSAPACVTPIDRFAPPAPTDLTAFPSGSAVELSWTASPAADVSGYVVLRGEGANGTLQPLTPVPIAATEYRDQAVRSGATYVYAVRAVDGAVPPNVSALSNRQVATIR